MSTDDKSHTPRTDAALMAQGSTYNAVVERCENVIAVARELEHELAKANDQLRKVDEALDEAGAPTEWSIMGLKAEFSRRGRIRRLAESARLRSDAASHGVLPDCMIPDGAEPCAAYQYLERELQAARAHVAASEESQGDQKNAKAARWRRIADQRAIEVADLRLALQWCVEHDGECLGDHPKRLEQAKAALACAPSATSPSIYDSRLVQVGWANIGTEDGKRYIRQVRTMSEGRNELFRDPVYYLEMYSAPMDAPASTRTKV